MLRPTKHSHPDRTVISLSLVLISHLRRHRLEDYDKLKKFAKEAVSGGDILFMPTLNFLYLLGLVDYHPKTGAIVYLGQNEAI